MTQRHFVKTWFLRVLCFRPQHLKEHHTLSGEFSVIPIIEYLENGETAFGMFHTPETKTVNLTTMDIIADLRPMFLKKSLEANYHEPCVLFADNFLKTDGTKYTLDEAYLIFMEGLFTARTITEYLDEGYLFHFSSSGKNQFSDYVTNMPRTIEYSIEAYEILKDLNIVEVVHSGKRACKTHTISDSACFVKLKDDIEGYYICPTSQKSLRISWPHFAMRFWDEDAALTYLEKNSYSFRNIGYEIERIPVRTFIPESYPD